MELTSRAMGLSRAVWIVASIPLAALSSFVILVTFPGVLANNGFRLATIGYVVVSPIIFVCLRPRNVVAFNIVAVLLMTAQIVSFLGFISFWF